MRLSTKEQRENLLKYEHEMLIKKGYQLETFKDLKIYSILEGTSTILKIFRGTSTKPIIYTRYRTEEAAKKQIETSKSNSQRREAYKKELKENPTKSSHANCAKAIRAELKKLIPNIKFAVRSESFANGDAVRVSWENGPTTEQIDEIVNKYAYGRFDSMQDLAFSEHNPDLPQAKFVSTYREITEDLKTQVKEALKVLQPDLEENTYNGLNDLSYRIISKTPIPLNFVFIGLVPRGEDEEYTNEYFKIAFETPEAETKTEAKETKTFEKVEAEEGEIKIVDYSEKSFAIVGDTKPIKDDLKSLGGKFNFRLSCGPGWIFSKTKLEEIQNYLKSKSEEPTKEEPTKTEVIAYDGSKNENGSFNIPGNLQCFDHSGTELTNTFKREEETETFNAVLMADSTLKDEVSKTINFLAELDTRFSGQVSESVQECARVQEVEIQENPEYTQLTFF